MKEDLSRCLEQIDLLGVVGIPAALPAKFMAALGATGGVEVRALLGRVDLFS